DETFRMSFCPDLGALKTSMGKIGLINPITIRGRGEERFQIVSGYRRALAAQSLEWEGIKAAVYTSDELSPRDGFLLNFFENLGTRRFNLIEGSMIVAGFYRHCGYNEKKNREEVLPLLGLHSGEKIFFALQSLKNLNDTWKELVIKNEISLLNAAKISSFSSFEQSTLYDVLSGLKLGENKLRETLEMAEEVCKRDEILLSELFSSEQFKFLDQGDLNLTEKTEQFRKTLKAIRYPELTRKHKEFQDMKKKLLLPLSVSLEPPDAFEGDKVKVTFGFRSPEEFRSILKKLETAAESEALKNLLTIL
ncbi:MAG TPA: ParB N-terminal domain-containing protein, partial [Thermodesulfobacteriota bacterium]|nr:ParB N-terminal domain-containing protein [Thermodesulfobacteriota bacterium]